MTREEQYKEYKRLLLQSDHIVQRLVWEADILASFINNGVDVKENTEVSMDIGEKINIEVSLFYAILNDALRDWFAEEIKNDEDLPRRNGNIILNREEREKKRSEDELRDMATIADIMANAKPYTPVPKPVVSKAVKDKKKAAKKARKIQKSLSKK